MNHRTLPLALVLLAIAASCRQMPARPSGMVASGPRYVEAAALASGDEYADQQVLTSVVVQHVAVADAEARLRARLPEGVLVSRVGATEKILIQGRGQAVQESIRRLASIDVR